MQARTHVRCHGGAVVWCGVRCTQCAGRKPLACHADRLTIPPRRAHRLILGTMHHGSQHHVQWAGGQWQPLHTFTLDLFQCLGCLFRYYIAPPTPPYTAPHRTAPHRTAPHLQHHVSRGHTPLQHVNTPPHCPTITPLKHAVRQATVAHASQIQEKRAIDESISFAAATQALKAAEDWRAHKDKVPEENSGLLSWLFGWSLKGNLQQVEHLSFCARVCVCVFVV